MTDKLSEDTVSARIPRWLKEKLKGEARRRLAPVSQIVREAIAEKLQRDVGDENPRLTWITSETIPGPLLASSEVSHNNVEP